MEIAQWTSDVRHLPGKLNWVADSLSRPENVPLGTAHTLQTNLDALQVTGDDGATATGNGRTADVSTANVWLEDGTPADGATEVEVTGGFQTTDVWDFGETAEGSTPADGATGNEQTANGWTADVWTADVTPPDLSLIHI